MRTNLALTVALFHLFGIVGVPVVAYSCVESGEAGVVSYLASSPRSCYVDSCCESDPDTPNAHIRSEVPCCDSDVQIASVSVRTLLPDRKTGSAETSADTPACFDVPRPNVRMVSTHPSISVFHSSISPPLRI